MENKFRWECTCSACPEQYDIWYGDKLVAYFRLRWGCITVRPYTNHSVDWNEIIFSEEYGDSMTGCFDGIDFNRYRDKIEKAILEYYTKIGKQKQK